ncbi:Protein-disulfide isomerase [Ferrimonas sediminum]|uniref:Protein-disulfide isomerase n=1 Tax=Ferrimonas sediminum TaxID=718193 RepID=A0A1G8PUJ6_9GAMM|nr:DsbA family protein [Ferrimonas sediminum]SDI95936.1 Protein-disulfide isomerase [Ferrimonas sediminum]
MQNPLGRQLLICFAPLFCLPAFLAIGSELTEKEQALVDTITQQVLEELRQGDALQQEIQAGIEHYIATQKQAQEDAKQEQQRLALEKYKQVRPPTPGRDHFYGAQDAPITLIEYSDFECPFCKQFHATAKQLVDQSEGQINWVYRHYPLYFHNPGAQKQAEASECAFQLGGDKVFTQYTDTIYHRTRSGGKGFPLTQLTPLAEELGLDANAFQECLDNDSQASRVQEDFDEGASIGITGTPGNILRHNDSGDIRLVSGAKPLLELQQQARELMEAAAAPVPSGTASPTAKK